MDILIPSLGDIDEVEVIELCIAPGASVAEGDTLIVIESDKASMDVPATCDGVLQDYKVQLGELVSEGAVIATLSTEAGKADVVADNESAIAAELTNEPVTETKSAVTEPQVAESVSKIDILVPETFYWVQNTKHK